MESHKRPRRYFTVGDRVRLNARMARAEKCHHTSTIIRIVGNGGDNGNIVLDKPLAGFKQWDSSDLVHE